ncbi:terminase [Streptomyces lunaelactis]|uniref:terminase n=1 Tax=Streptomyces lunaelactis TaxID=1535768 RepID=UPI0015855498|nr:terminase [Streptomyces lunaelactis]NUK72107.1 terminase [Streptomyces lunaelactis]NUK80015.1 terminase [Streptomyces lunaelactis]
MPWRGPRYQGELPTLGHQVINWMHACLAAPDRSEYEPFRLTREQAQFVLNLYAIDPVTGERRYRRAVLSRPKGWGKSPLLAALTCAEALADVVPDGWDANGEPVGRPWSSVRTPWLQLAAVSEDQTKNAWAPLLEMLREGPVMDDYPGIEPLDTFVVLPQGRIEYVTSAATSREGNRPIWCVLDQTEEWRQSNGGVRLAATLRRNLGKTGGTSVESPNAYVPGAGSVAENSAEYFKGIREGRARDKGLLYDHREAPADTELGDRDSLMRGLAHAYGDSAVPAGGWVNLERIAAEIWDPDTDPQDARRFYLGQITHASDSWISQPEWAAVTKADAVLADKDTIVLGFDGSRRRSHAVTDATALVGCRVSDGHLFLLGCWEQPDGPQGRDWEVPTTEVLATVADAFKRYRVVGMYADPAKWESHVATWEAKYGRRLKVKSSMAHPIEWWMTGGRSALIVRALEKFRSSVVDQELSHDGSSVLTRHILNARRRESRSGIQIMKEHPESPRKIDAAVAAVLAWQCRVDAVAKGLGKESAGRGMPGKGRVIVLR